jgi:glycine/D-amino acid oxidase-like deaminating enzyme
MNRRQLLERVATGVTGAMLSGCAPRRMAGRAQNARYFAPVRVAESRIIRTVVGLRPYRPSGFMLRAEKFDDRVVVHDYGHGGGGITLSWGTARLAADEALATGEKHFAVIGAGVIGLSTAILLQRAGAAVTIYTKAMPPNTTSNIAGGQWSPFSVFDPSAATQAFRQQFQSAARIAYREFQNLLGWRYGVHWIENYFIADQPIQLPRFIAELRDVYPDIEELPEGAHPFPAKFATRISTMLIQPHIYLPALLWDFRVMGGIIEIREFHSVTDVLTLPQRVILNCTGLGAREIFADPELTPVKGQLHILMPQPEVDYMLLAGNLYMFPRTDGILLGGTFQRGAETLEPDPEATRRILDGHRRLFGSL